MNYSSLHFGWPTESNSSWLSDSCLVEVPLAQIADSAFGRTDLDPLVPSRVAAWAFTVVTASEDSAAAVEVEAVAIECQEVPVLLREVGQSH